MIPVVVDDNADAGVSALDEAAINELLPGTALLIVWRGNSSEQRFLINAASTIAGRSPDADIFLDDVTVSRKHAEFLIEPEGLIVRDLGSLNGTYVNRDLIEGQSQLHTGDEVQIGKYKMVCFASSRGLS
ncbi:MAG: FHA domain-containing protein [Propionibacteriaceae bacterium]